MNRITWPGFTSIPYLGALKTQVLDFQMAENIIQLTLFDQHKNCIHFPREPVKMNVFCCLNWDKLLKRKITVNIGSENSGTITKLSSS